MSAYQNMIVALSCALIICFVLIVGVIANEFHDVANEIFKSMLRGRS